jgi:hypothetical protein
MAANINVNLSGVVLQVIDNAIATARVNSSVGTIGLPGSEATHIDYMPINNGIGLAVTLPAPTIWVLFVRNLGGINGTPVGNITVQTAVVGGALVSAQNSPVVLPGGVYIYWQPTESAGGIISVNLVASVNNVPAEILMAA